MGERFLDGDCQGGVLVDKQNNQHKNVVYDIEVTIKTNNVTGTFGNGEIRIKDLGRFRAHSDGEFSNNKLGQFFYNFEELPVTECDLFKLLQSGKAIIHKSRQETEYQEIISVVGARNDSIVTLLLDQEKEICGRKGYSTNEDGLFIVIEDGSKKKQPPIPPISFHDFSESDVINSRITTMFLDLGKKLHEDFHSTLREICISRTMAVTNLLSSVGQQSTGLLDTQAGVEIIPQGATSYIVWGNPLPARLRSHHHCCAELPILVESPDGTTHNTYMDPRTSVIRPYCTRRACDPSFPYTYHIKVYKSMHDSEGISQYLCTSSTPKITKCGTSSPVLPIMQKNITLEITKMMNKESLNPKLVSEDTLRAHHNFMLTRGAQWSIMADTAQEFVRDSPDKLHKVMSSSPTSSTFSMFKTGLFQSLAPYFSRLWTDFISIIAGILIIMIIIFLVHRLIVMILKRMTHHELPTKRLGLSLGGKRIVKHMNQRHDDLEEEVRRLMTESLRNEANWSRTMDKVESVGDRLTAIEEENPTTALRNLSSKLSNCQTH